MARKTIIKKKIQKVWYDIIAPKMFDNKKVGSTTSSNKDHLNNRILKIPLNEITGNFKHFYINIVLRIKEVTENSAIADYIGQTIRDDKILRLVNRWSSRIDSIDDITTKDNKKIRVKSIAVTRRKVNTTIKSKIRLLVSEKMKNYCETNNLEQIVNSINNTDIQKIITKEAKKIYPLKAIEVRKIEVLNPRKKVIKMAQPKTDNISIDKETTSIEA
ncbi:MAG: hypothetical protein K0B02_00110 [DPANN group archaeon]|nr:hypothetical protein [DPANN group archaeon]